MAHEFGPALRASCAFESHITLAHRVLPHIEDWLAATRTRKVCRHSDTGYAGNVPAATRRDIKGPTPGFRTPEALMRSEATGAFRAGFTSMHLLQTDDGTTARRAAT